MQNVSKKNKLSHTQVFALLQVHEKIRKTHTLFAKLGKPHFWPILGPIKSKNPKTRVQVNIFHCFEWA